MERESQPTLDGTRVESLARRSWPNPADVIQVRGPTPSRPRRTLSSHGPDGDALVAEVRAATSTLAALMGHREHLGTAALAALERTVKDVDRRLDRGEICVAVVGEPNAGKRTFLDALLGDRLLGGARRHPDALVFLRHGPSPSYCARFTDGRVDEFATHCPDRSTELELRVAAAAASESAAAAPHAHAERTATEAAATADRREAHLQRAHASFESARDHASRLANDLAAATSEAGRLEVVVADGARRLPSVARTRPPWWAVWLWIARVFFLIVAGRAWRSYAQRAAALERARSRAGALRIEASRAAQACLEAEAALAQASTPVEEARGLVAAAQHELVRARVRLDQERALVAAALRDLERHAAERTSRFFEEVRALTDSTSRGKGLAVLDIEYPARLLPGDVALLDVPGATGAAEEAGARAWDAIREHADGCILISELQRAVSGPTMRSLKRMREIVPHVILVLTKMDEAFVNALHKGEGEPWQHVEQARRIGTRRFAREVGREPATVLSLAVAAKPALGTKSSAGLGARFDADAGKLFLLLRHERALILGARSAAIVRSSIANVAEAEVRAAAAYQARIATLEAQRIPEPASFCAEQLEAAAGPARDGAHRAVEGAVDLLAENVASLCTAARARVDACSRRAEIETLVVHLEHAIAEGLERAERDARAHLESRADASARELEARVFEALRRRYELTHEIRRGSESALRFDAASEPREQLVLHLGSHVAASLRALTLSRMGLGAGGAAAGALVGTAIVPGVGTAVGAAVGALLALARTLRGVKQRLAERAETAIRAGETEIVARIRSREPEIRAAIEARVAASIDEALARFARWIAEPLEAERTAIDGAHAGLRDLQELRRRLERHDARLEALKKAAADASIGLCR